MHFKPIVHRALRLAIPLFFSLTLSAVWAADAARVVFVAGSVKAGVRALRVGDTIQEGELLQTGPDGYLYLETPDRGFFILRPGSTGQIVSYHIDEQNPANTRIKLELQSGVARHISGSAVKNARQNFRFNTPVAAVGVRGTDFTVAVSPDTTRIAVLSGGVVVSPLDATCTRGGFGPCEGPTSRELFADRSADQILQVARGKAPILLPGKGINPDTIAPPRPDEPSGLHSAGHSAAPASPPAAAPGGTAAINLDPLITSNLSQSVTQPQPTTPQLVWGRWQVLLGQPVQVNVATLQDSHQLIATNNYFAVMRNTATDWQPPALTSLGFGLQQSQAYIQDERSRAVVSAQLENGQLQLNFAQASFFTQFDLVSGSQRTVLQNTGEISRDGRLTGGLQYQYPNNMDVRGAIAAGNLSAAYVFQARIDATHLASGVTQWGK